jgi:hypothetical protein
MTWRQKAKKGSGTRVSRRRTSPPSPTFALIRGRYTRLCATHTLGRHMFRSRSPPSLGSFSSMLQFPAYDLRSCTPVDSGPCVVLPSRMSFAYTDTFKPVKPRKQRGTRSPRQLLDDTTAALRADGWLARVIRQPCPRCALATFPTRA